MMISGQRKTIGEKKSSAKYQFGIHYCPTSKVLPKKNIWSRHGTNSRRCGFKG